MFGQVIEKKKNPKNCKDLCTECPNMHENIKQSNGIPSRYE